MSHHHVASGIAGYGPDAADSDGFFAAADLRFVADAIRDELRAWIDYADESANAFGDAEDYASAWREHKRAEALDNTSRNFDNARADAPLYRGQPDKWRDTIEDMIGRTFPLDVSESSRLYVWECSETECEPTGEIITRDIDTAVYRFDDGSIISVSLTDAPDDERRTVAQWDVIGADGETIGTGTDLRSGADGVGGEPAELLRALASFLGACAESRSYPDGENREMFSEPVGRWAEAHDDELGLASMEDDA